jgi:gamma-glutamyl-gamma-aminobutyrate hydrolase PuuD
MAIKLLTFTLLIALAFSIDAEPRKEVNDRPVVGILTLDIIPYFNFTGVDDKTTYIDSAYVQWVQQSGARVVPIKLTDADEIVEELVPKLNGVLFTGGDSVYFTNNTTNEPSPFLNRACKIFDMVK